jgi:hypothetical protein
VLEVALFVPIIITLLVGMQQIGKVTYLYYTLRKTIYTAAKYVASQQGVNFCDDADPVVLAAKNFALTGTVEGDTQGLLPALTADMIAIRIERYTPESQDLGECECTTSGCDTANNGTSPDYVVVSIPEGYQVQLRIPFLTLDPILLKPKVRVPFGGTS